MNTSATTPPEYHEQARQLVEKQLGAAGSSPIYQTAGRLIEQLISDIASFAAEAATQALYQASEIARHCNQDDAARDEPFRIAETILRLTPDPNYLDRVHNEAATAALEQAVQVAEDYFTLKGNVWVEKYGNVKLEDAIRAIAAIGDDRR